MPGIGASGAIFGVEGAFAVRFGARYLRFFLAPIGFLPFLGVRIRVRAAIVLLWGFLEQLLLLGSEGSHIAYGAHVGGFAFGMLAAVAVWAAGIERRRIHPAIEAQIGWQQNPLLVRARGARFAGNPAHARRDVRRVLWEDPGNADAWALAARLALDLGDGTDAVRCAGRAIPLYLGMERERPCRRRGAGGAAKGAPAPFAAVRGPGGRAHGAPRADGGRDLDLRRGGGALPRGRRGPARGRPARRAAGAGSGVRG